MTLKGKIRLAALVWPVTMIVGWLCARIGGQSTALGFAIGFSVGLVAARAGKNRLIARAFTRFRGAVGREDLDAARRAFSDLAYLRTSGAVTLFYEQGGGWEALVDLHEAALFTLAGNYAEGRAHLEARDPRRLPAGLVPHYYAALAMCMARCGDPTNAVRVALRTLDSPALQPAGRTVVLEALGVAHLLADQPREAAEALAPTLAVPSIPASRASRAYHLGEALKALGRSDEAARAYETSCSAAPASRYGVLASARLKELGPYRG